jgi:hypothetical protein
VIKRKSSRLKFGYNFRFKGGLWVCQDCYCQYYTRQRRCGCCRKTQDYLLHVRRMHPENHGNELIGANVIAILSVL